MHTPSPAAGTAQPPRLRPRRRWFTWPRILHAAPVAVTALYGALAVTGDNLGYWIGRQGGYRLARKYGPKVRLDERKLKIVRYIFDRHGGKVVFFGRFGSVLRTYAAFLAGANRMHWHRFLPANVTGAITWAGACTLAAYLAGGTLQHLSGTIDLITGGTTVLIIAAALLLLRRHAGGLARRAEAAYPGPLT